MLHKIHKDGVDLACEDHELHVFLAEGWELVPDEPVVVHEESSVDPELRLVAMNKGGDIRLCEINQVKWMLSLGWSTVEGNENGTDERNLAGISAEGLSGPAEERGPTSGGPGREAGPDGPSDDHDPEQTRGPEADLTPVDDLTPEEAQTVKLAEAMLALDKDNDAHWTGLGLPRINHLEKVLGVKELTKADLEKAIPGFKRPE